MTPNDSPPLNDREPLPEEQDVPKKPKEPKEKDEAKITATDLGNRKFVRNLRPNLASDVLVITEDKVKLVLIEEHQKIVANNAWQVPAGILATLITVMITSSPKDALGLGKDVWHAFMIIATVVTTGWLIRDVVRAILNRGCTIGVMVEKMKLQSTSEHTEEG